MDMAVQITVEVIYTVYMYVACKSKEANKGSEKKNLVNSFNCFTAECGL